MQKLDRLGWAAGTAFRAYGVRFGVRVSEPSVPEAIGRALPPSSKPITSPIVDHLYSLRLGGGNGKKRIRRYHLLYSESRRIARSMDLAQVIQALESDLQISVALGAKNRLFVHAGVVAWRNRAILLPGRSFTGKGTLVQAMVRAGANYYSDEYAVLDSKGRVHPYPRALSLREGDAPARKIQIEDLGGSVGRRPLPIGLVVVSEYKPGAAWRPIILSPAQAMLALLGNTVVARLRPQFALATLKTAIDSVPVLKGVRGEADEAAANILSHLESRAA